MHWMIYGDKIKIEINVDLTIIKVIMFIRRRTNCDPDMSIPQNAICLHVHHSFNWVFLCIGQKESVYCLMRQNQLF